MKTLICTIAAFFCINACIAQSAGECFKNLRQSPSKSIPAVLTNIQKRLTAIDFYLEDHQKVIKRVEEKISFNDDSKATLGNADCGMLDNYNIFRMYVRKRKAQNGVYHPKFTITAFEFSDAQAATVFYEKVMTPISKVRSEKKHAYTCLLSGKYCYYIETPAFMFHYDFMDKIVKAIDERGRKFDHF